MIIGCIRRTNLFRGQNPLQCEISVCAQTRHHKVWARCPRSEVWRERRHLMITVYKLSESGIWILEWDVTAEFLQLCCHCNICVARSKWIPGNQPYLAIEISGQMGGTRREQALVNFDNQLYKYRSLLILCAYCICNICYKYGYTKQAPQFLQLQVHYSITNSIWINQVFRHRIFHLCSWEVYGETRVHTGTHAPVCVEQKLLLHRHVLCGRRSKPTHKGRPCDRILR